MLREVRTVRNVVIDCGNPTPGVNDNGTMALVRGRDNTVFGRGLLTGGPSCIFAGELHDVSLTKMRSILSPTDRSQTEAGQFVYGYEDPTFVPDEWNPFANEDGILCTEAYWAEGTSGPIHTNLLYLSLDENNDVADTKTVFTPEQAMSGELGKFFTQLDMVKEAALVGKTNCDILFEVGADGHARIVECYIDSRLQVTDCYPFLFPIQGTWFSEHVSTVCPEFSLVLGTNLLLFNGRSNNCWGVGWALCGEGVKPFAFSPGPFILPPPGVAPGPHGQQIAFGSDGRVLTHENGGRPTMIEVLYHAQDRYPCLAECELIY